MTSLLFSVIALHLTSILILSFSIFTWKSNESTKKPSFSIVVAAYNELKNLRQLIPLLERQSYPDFEIIIVLDRSVDGSKEYLEERSSKTSVVDITTTPEGWDHKKYALTQGIQQAKGEWIALTDADCRPHSVQWLESIAKEITNEKDLLIGISPIEPNRSFISYYAQFEGFMTYLLYAGFSNLHKPYMAVGRNMAIRTSFWHEKKGYDPIRKTTGGDDDLFIQMNATKENTGLMMSGKDSLMYTGSKKAWSAYWTQKIRHYSVSSAYDIRINYVLSLFHLFHLLAVVAILYATSTSFFLPIILFYLFIKLGSYRFVTSKIGTGSNYILFPIVDIMYAFITPVLGIWSQLKKDIKWKN